jgi:NAD-dependent dihydropyrimidine dehydrogenase PreA subunit
MGNDDKIYRDLQKFLDTKSAGGFIEVKSGLHMHLLKLLFTPQEARIATLFTLKPEPIKIIHERAKNGGMSITIEELKRTIDNMVQKACIRPYFEGYDETHYACTDTTSGGFISQQVDRLTPDNIPVFLGYFMEAVEAFKAPKEHNALRTVPINKSIPNSDKFPVGNYDDIKKLVEDAPGPFAVANCICRQAKRIMGEKCEVTELEESCLLIGPDQARRYVNMGNGRLITREEVFDILAAAQKDGLVLQPENNQAPEAICCCCGDCCVYLTKYKNHPRPAELALSNYYIEVDFESCSGCEACIDKCQMDARVLDEGVSTVNLDRCIGCGICVDFCPENANQVLKKDEEYMPVTDKMAHFSRVFSERKEIRGL